MNWYRSAQDGDDAQEEAYDDEEEVGEESDLDEDEVVEDEEQEDEEYYEDLEGEASDAVDGAYVYVNPQGPDDGGQASSPRGREVAVSSSSRKAQEGKIIGLARWTTRAWNGTKSWFLGPLFIGIALGAGISMGRSLFFVTMQRTSRLLLGPHATARFSPI